MSPGPERSVPPDRLELHFADKKASYSDAEAVAEANRCLYCFDAPCITACPTSIDIPTFIRKISTDNLKGSARTILQANLLGASCARVCPVEVLCEGACVYVGWGRKPIEIGRLQRHAMECAQSPDLLHRHDKRNGSIGLVGAGPASLACAGTLSLLGYDTVVYEKADIPGGLNVTGVAPYKLRVEDALREVAFIESLGVEIHTGVALGEDVSGSELLDRHDAVFFAPGLGRDSFRGVPGATNTNGTWGQGISGAVEWIAGMKLDARANLNGIRSVAVIGGGNTALDVAQELPGLGVDDVYLVYRRSEAEMPGYRHEWKGAKEKQVELVDRAAVAEVVRDEAGQLQSIVLVRTEGGAPTSDALDALPVDLIVVATGQEKLAELAAQFDGVQCDERGRVVADETTMVTGNPRVFSGGDCRNGGKEVVNAVDEGQRAAHAIDRMLRGESGA